MTNKLNIAKTTVTYTQTRKINLGNYESTDIMLGVTFESYDTDAAELLYAKAGDIVEEALDAEEIKIRKQSLDQTSKKKGEVLKNNGKDKEEKPKKTRKKKETKKEETKTVEQTDQTDEQDMTLETVKIAIREYAKKYSKQDAKNIIYNIGGVKKLADIPEDKFADVLLACENEPEKIEDEDDDI